MKRIKSPKRFAKVVALKGIIGSQSGSCLTGIRLDNAKTPVDPPNTVEAGTFTPSICGPMPSVSLE